MPHTQKRQTCNTICSCVTKAHRAHTIKGHSLSCIALIWDAAHTKKANMQHDMLLRHQSSPRTHNKRTYPFVYCSDLRCRTHKNYRTCNTICLSVTKVHCAHTKKGHPLSCIALIWDAAHAKETGHDICALLWSFRHGPAYKMKEAEARTIAFSYAASAADMADRCLLRPSSMLRACVVYAHLQVFMVMGSLAPSTSEGVSFASLFWGPPGMGAYGISHQTHPSDVQKLL